MAVPVLAPKHPLAVQGPTDPTNLYAIVTWDRNDDTATGYKVYRDGVQIGTTSDSGAADDWDKRYFKDTGVTPLATHSYTIRPTNGSGDGPLSAAATLAIRRSGHVFDITNYAAAGTLRQQIAAARIDAVATLPTYLEPAVILFPAATYTFSDSDTGTFLSGDQNIIIRGSGMTDTDTIFQAGFSGSTVESGFDHILIRWSGATTPLTGVNPASSVARGTSLVTLNTTASFKVGDFIGLNAIASTNTSADDTTENYDAWDVNVVTSISGNIVHVKYPWAKPFTTTASVVRLTIQGCGIEQCTVQGASSSEQGYYTLLAAEHCANHSFAEVRFRWCNRNAVYTRGYKHSLVACTFTQTDPRADGGQSFRYVVTAGRGMRLATIACTFGDSDRVSSSFMTTQVAHKQVVRHNTFTRSVHYGWNQHGSGDYWDVVENNYFYMPECDKGGVFLGNSSFFYAGPTIVRGNLFDQCATAAIACQQNTYGVRMLRNWFRDCPDDLVNWYGSQFTAMNAATYGSARIVARKNKVTSTGSDRPNRGYVFGQLLGSAPYAGIRDLILDTNLIDVDANAVLLGGNSSQSYNLQVSNNTGLNDYIRPHLVTGDYWAGNADAGGDVTGSGTDLSPYLADTFSGTAGTSAGWPVFLRTTATGMGSDFTISSSGNYGRLSATTATSGARKIAAALRSESATQSLQLVDLRNANATISRIQAVVARHAGGSSNDDHYRAAYEYNASSNRFRLEKVIGGVTTILAQTTSFDAALTHDARIRFEVTGSTVRASIWDSSGAEPGSWTLSTTDTSLIDNGKCGLLADMPDSTTESCDFDNYKLVNWTRVSQVDFGSPTAETWDTEYFDWELVDTTAEPVPPDPVPPPPPVTPFAPLTIPVEALWDQRYGDTSEAFPVSGVLAGSEAPQTGFHQVGEQVWNSAPTAGGYLGWVCVTAGTPGTWKTFGAITT